jgi:alpha-ketoglutaric semialdehyde dehydrogenase
MYKDVSIAEVAQAMQRSAIAFKTFSHMPRSVRASLMRSIAKEIEALGEDLIQTTMRETNLPEARLKGERARTMFQLTSYADACEKGDWLEARITKAIPDRVPPRPDIRKMLVPMGPVVVFGSSNFPYAYSTAGGDTASALAAGCTVVVKAHPAHPETSEQMAGAIHKALKSLNLPEDIFIHLHGASHAVGEALVKDEHTKAVGFTGSYSGGMALFHWANQRKEPIPVFAEMGSVNPVFLFNEKLSADIDGIAKMYADSITLGIGQFCTNPGIIVGLEGEVLQSFIHALGEKIAGIQVGSMLHAGIAEAYQQKSAAALSQPEIQNISKTTAPQPILTAVSAKIFLSNPLLHQEVFGPFSLVVSCSDIAEMRAVADAVEGQLTCTVMATEAELTTHAELLQTIQGKCGRIIFNGVPTGVEVCHAMQHGGPFPSSTDARFGSVGPDAIKRFARPLAFQNFPEALLPDELKEANPLQINRTTE